MFVESSIETYYIRLFLWLSRILHYNIAEDYRVNDTLLENIISSYIVISGTNHIFVSIDSTGLLTHASRYYTARTELKRKYVKLSNETDESQ